VPEVLQYLGTVLAPNGSIWHEFRHRALPGTNERKYWKIPATLRFTLDVQDGTEKLDWR
jgi:hypothetical protein